MTRIAIGDSIVLGTGQALGCKTDARVGAPSDEVLRRMVSAAGNDEILISVGSNDPTNPKLAANVAAIRAKVDPGARVVWIVPQPAKFPAAAALVRAEAAKHGDGTVLPTSLAADGVHPYYPALAPLVRAEFARLAGGLASAKPVYGGLVTFISANPRRLTDADLPRIGHEIGVGEDEIHAVLDVEAGGTGYDAQGRPKMLFEPHLFYKHVPAAKRAQAVNAGLAYAAWRPGAYPADSYPRLKQAMSLDQTAALKSASWGLGQILGQNHIAAGYPTPQAMVMAMIEGGEAEHLAAMVRFIKANHLDDEMRRHDWAGFARGYNGPAYATHGYHTKLAAAYARWQRIRDTPWSAAGKPLLAATLGEALRSPGVTPADMPAPPPPAILVEPTKPATLGGSILDTVKRIFGGSRR